MRLNKDKSEVLVMGPRFEASLPKQVFGIKVKRSAKYLRLVYNVDLSFKHSIRSFKPKINYIRYRLFRMLRITDFRTRYNLWQVFVMLLGRMLVSAVGEWKSIRAKECFELFQKIIRKTLRIMTLAPKNSCSEIFDYLSGWDKTKFIELIGEYDGDVEKATRVKFVE